MGAVIEVDHPTLTIGSDDDVGRVIRELFELFSRETHAWAPFERL
jgi:hypothetical protein